VGYWEQRNCSHLLLILVELERLSPLGLVGQVRQDQQVRQVRQVQAFWLAMLPFAEVLQVQQQVLVF
jgi:hypothetical protein